MSWEYKVLSVITRYVWGLETAMKSTNIRIPNMCDNEDSM